MPTIQIQGTIIEFPDSGQSPNWAPAIIEFAQAVELALNSVTGPYDVPAQILNIDAQNPGTNIDITALNFPVSQVRAAFIRYSVYRSTSTTEVSESGLLTVVYNPANPVSNKWEISREGIGDAQIDFAISDVGQVNFTTQTLSGIDHEGRITFVAQSLLQDS